MSLTQALLTSSSGLRVAQAGLALVSSNVANAETPGYVRKSLNQSTLISDGTGASVRVAGINREIDQYVLRELRTEMAGGGYADMRARFYERVQLLFGVPGAQGTVETSFNNLTTALQSLSTSPDSPSARAAVLNAAQVLTQQLNTMTAGVQTLRAEAEQGLADSVRMANEAMSQIASINQRLAAASAGDASSAALMDQRDRYVSQLATLMDVRVLESGNNQISVFTNSGIQLVGNQASQFSFDATGTMTAGSAWSANPAERSVGTIKLVSPSGDAVDLIANKSIRSGQIAAYVEMRDKTLVEAQAQLDALASNLARAFSDRTMAGAPVSVGLQDGFDIDVSAMQPGDSIRMTYFDVGAGQQKTVTFVRVDDPSVLPLSNGLTPDPNDTVVGLDFSAPPLHTQVAAALGAGFAVSTSAPNTLRILDDDGVTTTMNELTAAVTTTALANGHVEVPLFTDGSTPYTGAVTAGGLQGTGFAGRISVNASLLADPGKLVQFSTTPPTLAGDTTRPDFLLQQLSQATFTYSPQTGIGAPGSPYTASLRGFVNEMITFQGASAENAFSLQEGQGVVVNALQQRLDTASGVNLDEEMAHLLQLQAAYGANARVMSAVKEMLELLSRI